MGHPARSWARIAVRAVLAGLVLAGAGGCSAGRPAERPAATSPADVCAGLVSYWVKEALRGSKWAGLDWEQKGLSNEQLVIHDDVLAEARAEERVRGREAAEELADRLGRRRCEAANGATGSSENWRPPRAAGVGTPGSSVTLRNAHPGERREGPEADVYTSDIRLVRYPERPQNSGSAPRSAQAP